MILQLCFLLPRGQLISKMDLTEAGCVDWRWMELAWDCDQWLGGIKMLNLQVQLLLISKTDTAEICT